MLTERKVRDEKPGPKTRIVLDGKVKGLGLRITPNGAKSYILNYRVAGRSRRATLARADGGVSLSEVRKRAADELMRIRAGETDPLERERDAREAPTVNDLLDRFFREFVPARMDSGRMKPRTAKEYRHQANKYVRPKLGSLKVERVTRRDVERFADSMARIPTARNRTLAFLSRVFTLAEHWEWRPQRTNPCYGVERARLQPRDRTLAASEFKALRAALDSAEHDQPFAVAAIKVAAMTGCRIGEVLAMRWKDIDFETARAVLPDTKTGRRVLPLAAPVLEVLSTVPRVYKSRFVFPGRRGESVSYETVRKVYLRACKAAGIENVRLHDLRRSVATNLAASGLGAFAIRDMLGHSSTAMANRYVRLAGDTLTETAARAAALTSEAMAS